MIPHNRELMARHAGKPFTMLGINSDENRSVLKKNGEQEKVNWPNVYDGPKGKGEISSRWNVFSWPTIYVIDHAGVIRYKDLRGAALDAAVEELLAKVPKSPG